jgi:hypothetical protein
MGPGNFTVSVAVAPALSRTERLVLMMDGQPVGARRNPPAGSSRAPCAVPTTWSCSAPRRAARPSPCPNPCASTCCDLRSAERASQCTGAHAPFWCTTHRIIARYVKLSAQAPSLDQYVSAYYLHSVINPGALILPASTPDMAPFLLHYLARRTKPVAPTPDAATGHNRQYQQRNYRTRRGLPRQADQPCGGSPAAGVRGTPARATGLRAGQPRPCRGAAPSTRPAARVAPSCGGA